MKGSFMKIFAVLKKIWIGACRYYTVLSILVLLLVLAFGASLNNMMVNSLSFLLLFPFSLSLAASSVLKEQESLPPFARGLLRYLLVLAAFLLCVWLPAVPASTLMNWVFAIVLFTLLYWAVIGIVALTKKRFHSYREE